ncbi:UNKNOWN [Stylonychia lemnae]|uniref:Uncharacterized protein n=1 Tax=Stylonychia lemnae TaxID=5949 RepID=A0A078AU45_STYLE|nr:UNKNOWN [Stylonychia lemnae]|eukprot:CDW85501.1 UNKNOWN [Stylonychia lemnae]
MMTKYQGAKPINLHVNLIEGTEESKLSTIHNVEQTENVDRDKKVSSSSKYKTQEIQKQQKQLKNNNNNFDSSYQFFENENEEIINDDQQAQQQHYFTASFQDMYTVGEHSNKGGQISHEQQSIEEESVQDEENLQTEAKNKIYQQISDISTQSRTQASQQKNQINSFNAKLLTTQSEIKYCSPINVTHKSNQMHFQTTSSKQVNPSNNNTLSSMYQNPFMQDSLNEECYEYFGSVQNSLQSMNKMSGKNADSNHSNYRNNKIFIQGDRSSSANSSKKNSPATTKKEQSSAFFQAKIEMISKIQEKLVDKINEGKKSLICIQECDIPDSLNCAPKNDKRGFQSSQSQIITHFNAEENIVDTSEDQIDPEFSSNSSRLNQQPAGQYFIIQQNNAQTDQNRKKSCLKHSVQNIHNQNQSISPRAQQTNNQHHQTTSLYSTGTGFFNKSNDGYLGSLNNFVDAKVQTLHQLISEKKKIAVIIDEKHLHLKTLRNDKVNQMKQEDLLIQEIQQCLQRQQNLLDQNKDLEMQINLVQEKQIEKSHEYQNQFDYFSHQFLIQQQQYRDKEKEVNIVRSKEQAMRSYLTNEQERFKILNKQADDDLQGLKKQGDRKVIDEKNRVQFLRNKGNDIFKVIQDDNINQERSLARDKSNPITSRSNNAMTKNQSQRNLSNTGRSLSQLGTKPQREDKSPIMKQVQIYMKLKVGEQKNQNISCISIQEDSIFQNNQSIINEQNRQQSYRDLSNNSKPLKTVKISIAESMSSKSNASIHGIDLTNKKQSQTTKQQQNKHQSKLQSDSTKQNQQMKNENAKQINTMTSKNEKLKDVKLKNTDIKATYATVNLF